MFSTDFHQIDKFESTRVIGEYQVFVMHVERVAVVGDFRLVHIQAAKLRQSDIHFLYDI